MGEKGTDEEDSGGMWWGSRLFLMGEGSGEGIVSFLLESDHMSSIRKGQVGVYYSKGSS